MAKAHVQSQNGHGLIWRLFFFLAGASNVWHTCWRISEGPSFIMGTSRNAQLDLAFKLLNISGSLADTLEFAYDVTLWTLVCSGGLVYWAMGAANVFGGFCHYPQLCAFFGLVKLGVAASLLQIVSDGNAGPYTLLFGWAELGWAMGFFFWCKTVGFYAFKKDVGAKMGVSKSPATPTRRSSRNRSKKE